jgi:hypothetical protein
VRDVERVLEDHAVVVWIGVESRKREVAEEDGQADSTEHQRRVNPGIVPDGMPTGESPGGSGCSVRGIARADLRASDLGAGQGIL